MAMSLLLLPLLLLLLHPYTHNVGQQQVNTLLHLADAAALEDVNEFFGNFCSADSFPAPLPYSTNLVALTTNFTFTSASHPFASVIIGGTEQPVYGLYQCFGYLTLPQCSTCVATATTTANTKCPQALTARVELSGCSFLYQNTSISPSYAPVGAVWNAVSNQDPAFLTSRTVILQNVSSSAPSAPARYSSANMSDTIYAFAQCHEYLTQSQCVNCLVNAPDTDSVGLQNWTGARVFLGSCIYRYEVNAFYTDEAVPSPAPSPLISSIGKAQGKGANKLLPLVLGIVLGCSLLLGVIFCIFCIRAKRKLRSNTCFMELQETLHQRQISLFSLQQMKSATKDFHADNKLGQGGFGAVYKGKLQDGQVVAIKRLTHPSSQGKRQFLSEVETITSVQHRNLIRLLGCCVEGLDRLLVYEYLEKQSLDRHIFDIAEERNALAWSTRRKIILGTAKGLAYLHHESHVRIVHRDIKAANILLDDNLDPKIADFGLARLFTLDQTHVSTQIAGTIGYLAPEYATNGQLTEKSDIYSFGIVILEILSGRRVIDVNAPPEQQVLLTWAWTLYEGGRQLELVDEFLQRKADYVEEETNRMVHVALLCTQSMAALRPAMSKVMTMLEDTADDKCEVLEVPSKPILNTLKTNKWFTESFSDSSAATSSAASVPNPR